MNTYDFTAKTLGGQERPLSEFKGKVALIVNTASQRGFAYQYRDLQQLYDRYKNEGFVVLGFPSSQFAVQGADEDERTQAACLLNYRVLFPMFAKCSVRGESIHPLYQYLTSQQPFQGFREAHPIAKLVVELLQEHNPASLQDETGIRWNFTKFLIDPRGNVVKRYECTTETAEMEKDIEALLPFATS